LSCRIGNDDSLKLSLTVSPLCVVADLKPHHYNSSKTMIESSTDTLPLIPQLRISGCYMLFINFLKHKKCSHLFDPSDMQNRDENGNVKWKCCKCGKLFIENCGLDILKHGKCTGRWGISK